MQSTDSLCLFTYPGTVLMVFASKSGLWATLFDVFQLYGGTHSRHFWTSVAMPLNFLSSWPSFLLSEWSLPLAWQMFWISCACTYSWYPSRLTQRWALCCVYLVIRSLFADPPSWWECVECHGFQTIYTLPVLANHSSVVVDDGLWPYVMWSIAAIEFVTLAPVWFLTV